MPDFPPLKPATRTFTPAAYHQSSYRALGGKQSSVSHSNAALNSQLRLTFQALDEADRFAIEAHYHGQQGRFDPFQLPAETFNGTSIGTLPAIVPGITYSQSSTYVDNNPATFAGMTNGIYAEATETGTNDDETSWIKMDLGAATAISKVVIGTDFDQVLAGGWSLLYTEDCDVSGSLDDSSWDVLFNTGSFTQGIQEYAVDATVRYIKIENYGYLCATEFYAMTAGSSSGIPSSWRYVSAPVVEEIPGPYYTITVALESVTLPS